jgi:hypothetical protein
LLSKSRRRKANSGLFSFGKSEKLRFSAGGHGGAPLHSPTEKEFFDSLKWCAVFLQHTISIAGRTENFEKFGSL